MYRCITITFFFITFYSLFDFSLFFLLGFLFFWFSSNLHAVLYTNRNVPNESSIHYYFSLFIYNYNNTNTTNNKLIYLLLISLSLEDMFTIQTNKKQNHTSIFSSLLTLEKHTFMIPTFRTFFI